VALAATQMAPGLANADGGRWTAVPGKSRLVVHVLKKGLLSGLAHDHHFDAGEFRATAETDASGERLARLEVVVDAASLRDRQPDLSPGDRAKVDAQAAGEDVLDAARFPEIRFVAEAMGDAAPRLAAGDPAGVELRGTLTLRGRSGPVIIPVQATRVGAAWRARGSVRFKQSEFGIEPYSGFLGTIAVHDEVEVEWDLLLEERQPGG
jgi:polyisoprenoid-binding protein YceI